MAVKATFLSDFSQFQAGVAKAQQSLKGFEGDTVRVGAKLDALGKFDFTKLAKGVGAASTAVAGVATGVAAVGAQGAGILDIQKSFEDLTGAIGESSDTMLGSMRQATLGTVKDLDLMKTANIGLSQGLVLTAEQMGHTGDVAAVLADRVGKDTGDAFGVLVTAMATGNDRMLKTIGMNIDAEQATKDYAASIGKTVGQLDEEEKKTAIKNAILAESQRILGESGKSQRDFGDNVAASQVKLGNFIDGIKSWVASSPSIGTWAANIIGVSVSIGSLAFAFNAISPAVTALLGYLGIQGGLTGAFVALSGFVTGTILPMLATVGAAIAGLGAGPIIAIIAAIGAVVLAWKEWDTIGPIVKGVYDSVQKYLVDQFKLASNSIKTIVTGVSGFFSTSWGAISGIAQSVYTGIKTWLVDRFAAVVASIKAKVDAVTGFFRDMKDRVVGHSYVVEMMEGIQTQFGRLGDIMANPTRAATQAIEGLFGGMLNNVSGMLNGWATSYLPSWLQGVASQLMGRFDQIIDDLIAKGISRGIGAIAGAFGGASMGAGAFALGTTGGAASTAGMIGAGAATSGGAGAGAAAAGGGIGWGAVGAAALTYAPVAGALYFALTHLDAPTPETTMGGMINGQQVTIQEAIDYYNKHPNELPGLHNPLYDEGVSESSLSLPGEDWRFYASRGGVVTARGMQYFARGGMVRPRGTDTVPIMASPGETIRTPDQEKALDNSVVLHEMLRELRWLRRLPEANAIAIRDALIQSGRRRA